MSWYDSILYPIQVPVAWIMVQFHALLRLVGLSPTSGLSWALSIVSLVIVMRVALIPLVVRQINAGRGMHMLSPELQALQKKYKGRSDPASREAMTRETMELYRKHGTNPFSSCLPILAQSPIFLALFRVLYNMPSLALEPGDPKAYPRDSIGPLTRDLAQQFTEATIFGAKLSDWFMMPDATTVVRVVTVVLIVLMSVTTFTTQRQLSQKNMPAAALQGPMAQQQKMLLYILPLVFAISGVNFPIGVLIYWSTTNLWTMGQQFYVIRRNPTPGSEAERLYKERRARKAAARGIVLPEEEAPAPTPEKPKGQRQQPVRKDRARPRPAGAPGGAGRPTTGGATKRPDGAARPTGSGKAAAQGRPAGSGKPGTGGRPSTSGKGASGAARPRPSGSAQGQAGPRSGSATGSTNSSGAGAVGDGSARRRKGQRPGSSPRAPGSRPAGGDTAPTTDPLPETEDDQ